MFGGLPGVLSGTIWRLLTSRVAAASTLDEATLVDVALALAAMPPASAVQRPTDAIDIAGVTDSPAVTGTDVMNADPMAVGADSPPSGPTLSAVLRLSAVVLRGCVPGRPLSAQQRRYLAAVVAADDVWDAGNDANAAAFARVGLPWDRSLVRALADGAPMPAAAA